MSDHVKGPIYLKDLVAEPGAVAILSDYKDSTDPKYIGPGTWNVIHRRAYKARTAPQQSSFIEFMKDVCYGFPCFTCKGHCTEHIKNHPLEEYIGVLVDIDGQRLPIGMFVWTWKFHNAVNARIGKPIMSWNTAYNLYSEKETLVCSKNCLDAALDVPADGSEHITKPEVTKPRIKVPVPSITAVPALNPPVPSVNPTFRLIPVIRK
jgi:hypothetical protein